VAIYTLLQCSDESKDATKYFLRNNPENLLNIYTTDDDAFISISFHNDPNKFYTLSKDGLKPRENSDTLLKEANIASDFISNRLLTNFYNFKNSEEINLFSVFERDILPFFTTELDQNLYALYKEIKNRRPYILKENGVLANRNPNDEEYKEYERLIQDFNAGLRRLIDNINEKVNEFYKENFTEGTKAFRIKLDLKKDLAYQRMEEERLFEGGMRKFTSDDYREIREPFIKLYIQEEIAGRIIDIDRPQSYLNEAKLTAIALSIRFAVLEDRLKTADLKILALDDLLISLDMSHRETVLDLLFTRYKDKFPYQLLLLTHDREFFHIAKQKIKLKFTPDEWVFYEMYADEEDGRPQPPKVLESSGNLAKAKYHLKEKDYPASVNYLRKELEDVFQHLLPSSLRTKFKKGEITHIKMLGGLIATSREYFPTVGFDVKLIDEVYIYLGILLNPLSHHSPHTDIYRADIESVFRIIEKLKAIKNEVIIPGNGYIFFTIDTEKGNKCIIKFQLTDDLRLIKRNQEETSFFSEIKGNIINCITVIDGIEKTEDYSRVINKIPLSEFYINLNKEVKKAMKENPVNGIDIFSVIKNNEGKSLKELRDIMG